jgi:hypothetical protein
MEHNLFINKYQPLYFKDFEVDEAGKKIHLLSGGKIYEINIK